MSTVLQWRDYRYFEYERDFARREVMGLLGGNDPFASLLNLLAFRFAPSLRRGAKH